MTYAVMAKIAAYMEANRCGWIIRLAGQELGIVAIENGIATLDSGDTLRVIKNNVCIRKPDWLEIAFQDASTAVAVRVSTFFKNRKAS